MTWGLQLFLALSTPDLEHVLHLEKWWMWWYGSLGVLTVVILAGQYTRRGRRLLGLPPQARHWRVIPAGSMERGRLWNGLLFAVGLAFVAGIAFFPYVPGWHLLLGLVMGLAVTAPSSLRFERLRHLKRPGGNGECG
ncbi:hypothetical protein AB0C96_41585 [Streptomyces sp. NPDC048506]|uniref:hypothetical protein n=1 Tax=Streptomyces sp. NPDC048506 TaxID=3155028 RepID=UPI003416A354